jgi:2-oxoisovalerate dehydrogenase E1 component
VTTPQDLDERFREAVAGLTPAADRRAGDRPVRDGSTLTGDAALELFDAQLISRHLDLAARWLRSFGEGYYTIGSAGHEGNAAVAAAVRPTDPALLHYRSGAFYCARAGQRDGTDPVRDVLRGIVASAREPIAGGRHKVFGHPELNVVPTTSTIAAHLPRAVGVGFAIERARRMSAGRRTSGGGAPRGAPALGLTGSASGLTGSTPGASTPGASTPGVSGLGSASGVSGPGSASGVSASGVSGPGSAPGGPGSTTAGAASPLAGPGPVAGARGAAGRGRGEPLLTWPEDAIVVASFGDASVNHASAAAALNTAGWCDHSGLRLPVLFVCEDNGLGLSVRSPEGWVAAALRSRPGLRYAEADGCDLAAAYDAATETAGWVRRHRRPAVLRLRTVRLMGHAGADAEVAYRAAGDIAADVARDPLVVTARLLVDAGLADPDDLVGRYDEIGWQVRKVAEEVLGEPKLRDAAEVLAPLAPRRPVRVARAVADAASRAAGPSAAARSTVFAGRLPEQGGPLTLAQTINATLTDALLTHPGMVVFGEDVAVKGGVYGVTKGLRDRFGPSRVFDTLLDETSVLGLALGAGLSGLLPVPEIQYLAYLHNAEDQLRGEAATMQFFSRGAYRNPMVLRLPGLAYQEGFGGHFHNDNSVAVLRDIPGLIVAVPARAEDAAPMLRACLASAAVDGSVCVFVEPIALYHTRDLYADGDGQWLAPYGGPAAWGTGHLPVGRARVYEVGSAEDLTILTFGNGVRMSLRVAAQLATEGVGARVVDLRWLSPLPVADMIRESAATGRVLIVDETRRSGGVGEGVIAALLDAGYVGAARRIASVDSFIPLGPAARQVLVAEESITQGARALLGR